MIRYLKEDDSDKRYEEFTKNCQSNETYKKAKKICSKYGYTIAKDCYVEVLPSGREYINFGIMHPSDRSFLPVVYYYSIGFNRSFKIQTTAVGSLEIEEHDEYLKNIMAANKMVKELSKLDLSTLYRLEVKELE